MERSILVVEDQVEMANAIKRLFKRNGYDVKVANDGFYAGALLGTMNPGLVTLDLRMPGLDGMEVLKYIRSQNEHKDTKVIVISAELDSYLEKAKQLGADRVLGKPFENAVLLGYVKELLAD